MIIQAKGLTKYYGKTVGILDLDLEVSQGEIFGYLGPNGAGKTTTIRLLLDFIRPTKGFAKIFGLDVNTNSTEIKKRVGYIPGDVFFYDWMKGEEYLDYFARFHSKKKNLKKQLAQKLDLDLTKKVKNYSRGNRQKLAIISALMNDPELLILDEPTLGLDPLMQHQFYKILLEEREKGKTVFLSSHILSEVEKVCDRVGIVKEGKLLLVEKLSDLKTRKIKDMKIKFKKEIDPKNLKIKGVEEVEKINDYFNLKITGNLDEIVKKIANFPIEDLSISEASLEDIFLEHYQRAK